MIRVRQIKIEVEKDNNDYLLKKILKKLKLKEIINYQITKKSIDARNKENIYYIYEVSVNIKDEEKYLSKNKDKDILLEPNLKYDYKPTGNLCLNSRPIIIGAGPSGLFCGLELAKFGYKPIIIEQGEKIEDRVKTVEKFWETGKLNVNSNVQFGEGGAGTFSDGKLNTLVSDKYNRGKYVFDIFVECGAPSEIMYLNKPHIGTDLLRNVIINLRNKIISLGGEFHYNSKLTDIIIKNNKVDSIIINNNENIKCDVLVLAIGHSSRDTFKMLYDKKINMKSKPFAVGIRIIHPQKLINEIQYGKKYANLLDSASYKLTYNSNNRGVYSFCMCPGGYVVNSSSEDKRLVVNGMSNHDRNYINSNSALVVSVNKDDFGDKIFDGLEFQRKLEENAYKLGNGMIPIQLLKDFYENKETTNLGSVKPGFKGKYTFSNLNLLFPEFINQYLKEGINYFDTKMKGYKLDDAIIAGVESRTSSPIMIERDNNLESNIKGIFPSGEGCGYAGGITTASMDGIKTAEAIMSIYKNN